MKKVLLLGDSIRMGYDSYVKEELKEFEVIYDDTDNGRFTAYTIWQFNFLNNTQGPFDIVHFNNGYWDMNPEGPNHERMTPIDDYIHNFERLIKMIRETGATPIFATTTPIWDTPVAKDEYEKTVYVDADVRMYNEAATDLMKKEGIAINDLYTLLKDEPHYLKCPDSLHLLDEGYRKCAAQVSKVIREVASKK